MTKVLAILQGRMSSTRLPGKVLMPILGAPMIERQVERLRRCACLDGLVVATSVEDSDTPIVQACETAGIDCVRGPLDNVLGRFAKAVEAFAPDHVVRLTADCPLADWRVIDALVDLHLESGADYSSNALKRTYPVGLDCEAVKADVLLRANAEATTAFEREHVTPFMYQEDGRFNVQHLTQGEDLSFLRWTVDTRGDFAFANAVYEGLYPEKAAFTSEDIIAFLETREDVRNLNASSQTEEDLAKCRLYWNNRQQADIRT